MLETNIQIHQATHCTCLQSEVKLRCEKDAIVRYYRENQFFYDRFWKDRVTLSMNYGIWFKETKTLSQAFAQQNKLIAEALMPTASDVVLEAGCGTGGSSIWLARTVGCRVIGITLSDEQARTAKHYAARLKVGDRTDFLVMDFLGTSFGSGTFTRIFASESACYAPDKREFLAEAYRLLADNGILVVMDGFLSREKLDKVEQRLYSSWCRGWAVPNLAERRRFAGYLTEAGFRDVRFTDFTHNIGPSCKRIFIRGLLGYPLLRTLRAIGLVSDVQVGNASASICQFLLFLRGVGTYGLFVARK
jgi:tocopherol O-methyltransferase